MDSRSADISFPVNGLSSESNHSLSDSNHYPEFANGFDSFGNAFLSSEANAFSHASALSIDDLAGDLVFSSVPDGGSFDPNLGSSLTVSLGNESPSHSDDSNSSDPVLKYISQMLMEENLEDESWVFASDFALQDTEKSFSDVLGEQPGDFHEETPKFDVSQLIESPSSNVSESSSFQNSVGTIFSANSNSSSSADAHWIRDHGKNDLTSPQDVIHLNEVADLSSGSESQIYSKSISSSFSLPGDGFMDSAALIKNMFSDAESVLQFNKGLEEARKFLPDSSNLLINFGNISNSGSNRGSLETSNYIVKNESETLLGRSRGRKKHERMEELDVKEGRASKQSASNTDEAEFAELFDKVLLMNGTGESCNSGGCQGSSTAANKPQQPSGSNGGKGRSRRQGNKSSVDLRSLLVLCAQAVSTYDLRTANELLKQIRQNSSPNGDGSQRLAHYFADGLEARLAGTQSGGTHNFFASVCTQKVSIAKMLRAYQLHLCCCPFKKFGIIYANYLIYRLAEKATVLHIIDFGIGFGFQWPILIQKLGERHKEGHPPLVKLRITGIEFPQPGFRPTERIEETGRRLARYCERFNVPFEYKVIPSRNWETIQVEDLKVERNEMVAVNTFGRFNNILDDTAEGDSPRDAVLSLIRRIKPDVFLHFISNGSYNAPFFVTRFKEALFHLSSIYDMLDTTIEDPSKDEIRLVLEKNFYGREIMNVVSCEGAERVERPETYKQWQVRHVRAGFKQLPLSGEIMEKLRWKLKEYYHKDFVVDEEDGKWMLLGWKGRIMYGMSCWVPV